MILDVGCGYEKRGHFGIDIYKNPFVDLLADASHLPFKDNSFKFVVSHHVVEHLLLPEKAILEMVRVARSKVLIYVPWRNGGLFQHRHCGHKWSFTKKWFHVFAKRYGLRAHVCYSDGFLLPTEIEVQIFKQSRVN
jgi:ubiquinone/menaquinone biosynthesis C-methylase UbiE